MSFTPEFSFYREKLLFEALSLRSRARNLIKAPFLACLNSSFFLPSPRPKRSFLGPCGDEGYCRMLTCLLFPEYLLACLLNSFVILPSQRIIINGVRGRLNVGRTSRSQGRESPGKKRKKKARRKLSLFPMGNGCMLYTNNISFQEIFLGRRWGKTCTVFGSSKSLEE